MRKDFLYNKHIKRLIDVVLSLFAIIVLSPLFLILFFAIRIDSKGPAIFKQKRIGLHKKDFNIYKFRSMVQDASKIGASYTDLNDNRITRFGRFLRKTSMDELPQLFNVLSGHMSLIGPRPDVRSLANFDDPAYVKRFEVKPGITGMAQVYGRSTISYDGRCEMDSQYVEDVSFLLDCKLFFLTIFSVLKRRNTN